MEFFIILAFMILVFYIVTGILSGNDPFYAIKRFFPGYVKIEMTTKQGMHLNDVYVKFDSEGSAKTFLYPSTKTSPIVLNSDGTGIWESFNITWKRLVDINLKML